MMKKLTDTAAARGYRAVRRFAASHIAFSLISSGILILLLMALMFQTYLKNAYYQYLLDETTRTGRMILDAAAANLNGSFREALLAGAVAATDTDLQTVAERVCTGDGVTVQDRLALGTKLRDVTNYGAYFAAATVFTEDGLLMEYGRYWGDSGYRTAWREAELPVMERLYRDVMSHAGSGGTVYRAEPQAYRHPAYPEMRLVHLAFPLVGGKVRIRDAEAVIVLTFRLDRLVQNSGLAGGRQESIVEYITDVRGNLIFHNGGDCQVDETLLQLHAKPLNYFGWTLHTGLDARRIEARVNEMYAQAGVVYFVLLVLTVLVWQLSIRRILEPARAIRNAMERIGGGAFDSRIAVRGKHELWQLAEQYNRMVAALERQRQETQREFQEKTLSVQRQNEAEREALESQINAHFLFNTLGAINYSAIENGNTEVSELLKSLSNILFYSFSKETRTVTLAMELDWVRQYLYLQKYRLMDVFDYEIHFQEEYGEWPCCKLFLQPFVENSILHGFEGWEQGGRISIVGRSMGGRLLIEIQDNGRGMAPAEAGSIRSILNETHALALKDTERAGIGIRNAIARLRMYYGEGLSVSLETAPGHGTQFSFLLPIPPEFMDAGGTLEDEV